MNSLIQNYFWTKFCFSSNMEKKLVAHLHVSINNVSLNEPKFRNYSRKMSSIWKCIYRCSMWICDKKYMFTHFKIFPHFGNFKFLPNSKSDICSSKIIISVLPKNICQIWPNMKRSKTKIFFLKSNMCLKVNFEKIDFFIKLFVYHFLFKEKAIS